MNEEITDRGTQKRFHTKFHTMNIMRSGARLIKQSISRACRNNAVGIHESRQVHTQRLFRNLIPGCQPIVTKSRRFNNDDRQFIHNVVSKLLNDNIIEPSYSPWRAQVLVTKDKRHKRRMVVDYSQTINKFTLLDAYLLPNIDEQVSEIAKGTVFSTLDLKSAYYQLQLCPEDRPYTAFEACGKLYQYTRLPFGVTNGVSYFQRVIDQLIDKYRLKGVYAYVDNITVYGMTRLTMI